MSTGHSHKPLSTPIRGINLDRFSSFAPQEYPNKFGIPFGLSSVVRLPVAVPSGLLTQPHEFPYGLFYLFNAGIRYLKHTTAAAEAIMPPA